MSADTTPARLPLVGEAARPLEREVLASGQFAADAPDSPRTAAPIIALHGVGEIAYGDVIGEIARHPVFSRTGIFRRETVFGGEIRFTALMDARDAADPSQNTRLLEINWSEVRRAMPNLLGLLRNFVTLLMTLNRVGVHGAYGSTSLSVHLRTGVTSLWLVEAVLVWASLAPALSALLWQLDPGQRMAIGAMVGLAALYVAALVREVSTPLSVGGIFGLCRLRGRVDLLRPRRRTHVRRRRCPVAQLGHLGHLCCRADERGGDPVPPASARGQRRALGAPARPHRLPVVAAGDAGCVAASHRVGHAHHHECRHAQGRGEWSSRLESRSTRWTANMRPAGSRWPWPVRWCWARCSSSWCRGWVATSPWSWAGPQGC